MEQKDIAVLTERIKHIDSRITTLGGNYQALTKSYKVLNDNHHKLELDMTELSTQIKTCTALLKWLISPAMLIGLIIELARLGGLIS